MPYLADHLYVIAHAFLQSSGFQLTGLFIEEVDLLAEIKFYLGKTRGHALRRGYKDVGRVDLE